MTSILIKVSWTEYTDFLKSLGDGYFLREHNPGQAIYFRRKESYRIWKRRGIA